MPNSITSPRQNDERQPNKPTYTPDQWERKDGYFKDGVFHKPSYEIFVNGQPLEPLGISFGYRYEVANHILMHLQAVSDDEYTIEPTSWQPVNDYIILLDDGKELNNLLEQQPQLNFGGASHE